ncbi:MAG: FAD-dependent oxidoreductase [Arhodomonas sp.]|nr:FAD-dependent oxidoreductase [Arhodomonas sp.]
METQSGRDAARALRHLPRALKGWRPLAKGLGMLARLRRAGVPRYLGASNLAVLGDGQAEGLAFETGGQRREIECETVLLHQGVVPNIQITRALGCEHRWDEDQVCFHPVLDPWGRSSRPCVFVAGDGGGIYGAGAAELQGRIAALEIAHSLGVLSAADRDAAAAPLRRGLAREQAPRRMLDALYPPPPAVRTPPTKPLSAVARKCTAGEIRQQVALGCRGRIRPRS